MSENAESNSSNVVASAAWKTRMLGLLAVALLVRVVAAILIQRYVDAAGRPFLVEGDANGYWELARRIATGEEYHIYTPPRYILRVPGFPLLLAVSIKLFGSSLLAARLILAVVGTVCCWLTWKLGCRLHSPKIGFWAATFVAINPLHIGNSVLILSETWFTFWMLLSLLSLETIFRRSAPTRTSAENCENSACRWRLWLRSLLTGAIVGVTVLVRPGFLPWLGLCCIAVMCLMNRPMLTRTIVCLGLIAGCLATMLPWAARNATVTGHWVFTSLWSGPSLYDGLNPNATGASDMQFFDRELVMNRMSEYEMNAHYKNRAVEYAMNHPGHVAELAVKKLGMVLTPVPNFAKRKGWAISAICGIYWLFLVVTCVVGIRSGDWNVLGMILLVGPLLQFLLVHMVFVGSVRYRLPLEFPLAVLGAIGWQKLAVWWKNGSMSEPPQALETHSTSSAS